MTSPLSQQFFLFHEPLPGAGDGSLDRLAVPPGLGFLRLPLAGSPEILSNLPESYEDILILEPILTSSRGFRLAVLNPAAARLLVNGGSVPRAALLRERDEFSLNYGLALFVSIFRQPRIESPDPMLLGRPCPLCRTPFTSDSRAYHCQCGCGLHAELRETKSDPLQCAGLSDVCPRCQSPIVAEPGFSFIPEFAHA